MCAIASNVVHAEIPLLARLALLGGSVSNYQPAKPVAKSTAYSGVEAEAPVLRSDSEVKPDGYNYA